MLHATVVRRACSSQWGVPLCARVRCLKVLHVRFKAADNVHFAICMHEHENTAARARMDVQALHMRHAYSLSPVWKDVGGASSPKKQQHRPKGF